MNAKQAQEILGFSGPRFYRHFRREIDGEVVLCVRWFRDRGSKRLIFGRKKIIHNGGNGEWEINDKTVKKMLACPECWRAEDKNEN